MRSVIKGFQDEYARYKAIGEKALNQLSAEALNAVPSPGNNSIAIIVRHISGNLRSRFTDFLTTDGEKPWRHRDTEFDDITYSRQEVYRMWAEGWEVLQSELSKLTDDQLQETVYIRGVAHTIHEALCRSLAHVSYHVGQIVFLGRFFTRDSWRWISIPKGASHEYNKNPTMEKKPASPNVRAFSDQNRLQSESESGDFQSATRLADVDSHEERST